MTGRTPYNVRRKEFLRAKRRHNLYCKWRHFKYRELLEMFGQSILLLGLLYFGVLSCLIIF